MFSRYSPRYLLVESRSAPRAYKPTTATYADFFAAANPPAFAQAQAELVRLLLD